MCLGIPGLIKSISDVEQVMAVADFGGVTREVCLMALASDADELQGLVGKWIIVHAGFALSLLDEDEARASLDMLKGLEDAGHGS